MSWLSDIDTRGEVAGNSFLSSIKTPPPGPSIFGAGVDEYMQKAKEDAQQPWAKQTIDTLKDTAMMPLSAAEAAGSLAVGAASYLPGWAGGLGRAGFDTFNNLLARGQLDNPTLSPERRALAESVIKTPEKIREDALHTREAISGFIPAEPKSEMGKKISAPIEKGFEYFDKLAQALPHLVGVTPESMPRTHLLLQFFTELALFKGIHKVGNKASGGLKRLNKKIEDYKSGKGDINADVDGLVGDILKASDNKDIPPPDAADLATPESRQAYIRRIMPETAEDRQGIIQDLMPRDRMQDITPKGQEDLPIAEAPEPRRTVSGEKTTAQTNREARESEQQKTQMMKGVTPVKGETALENLNRIRADLGKPPYEMIKKEDNIIKKLSDRILEERDKGEAGDPELLAKLEKRRAEYTERIMGKKEPVESKAIEGELPEDGYVPSIKLASGETYVGVKNTNHGMVVDHYNLNEKLTGSEAGFTDSKGKFYTSDELQSKLNLTEPLVAEQLYPEAFPDTKPNPPSIQKTNEVVEPKPEPPPIPEVKASKKGATPVDVERLPEWVEPALEEIYNDPKAPKRMSSIAKQILETGEIDKPGLVKSFKKWYEKTKSAVEKVEVTDKVSDKVERVDPETGRAPGVEAPEPRAVYKSDFQAQADFLADRGPIKNGAGRIVKNKDMAQMYLDQSGVNGKLVKSGEGWRIRRSKADQAKFDAEMRESYEQQLREEGLGDVELETSMDLFDVIGNEHGSVKIDFQRLRDKIVKSWSSNHNRLLTDLIKMMHYGKVDLDVNYSSGKMWDKIDPKYHPKIKMDKFPQREGTIEADVSTRIPLEDGSINSIISDPPYLIKGGGNSKMIERFSGYNNLGELLSYHDGSMREFARVLKPGGRVTVKVQDISRSTGERASTIAAAGYEKARVADLPITDYVKRFGAKHGLRYISKMIYANKSGLLTNMKPGDVQRIPRKGHTEFLTFEKATRPIKENALLDKFGIGIKILKNNKGEIRIGKEEVKKLREILKPGVISVNDIARSLRARGVSEKQIKDIFHTSVQKMTEGKGESKFYKKGDNPNELLPRRKKSGGRLAPAVPRGLAHAAATAKDIAGRLWSEDWSIETGDKTFNRVTDVNGKTLEDNIYWTMKEATANKDREFKQKVKLSKALRHGLSGKSQRKIGLYALMKQEGGAAIAEQMGYNKVPKLTPAEMSAYNTLRSEFKEYYDRVNEAREAAGETRFPAVDNYFTWINDMQWLKEEHGIGMTENWQTMQSKLHQKQITPGFRFAKHRGGEEVPRKLELNPFTIYEKYSDSALNTIHKAEPLALINEVLLERYGMRENAPNLHTFLTAWREKQTGKPHAFSIANPKTVKALRTLNNNIMVGLLGGTVRSALIQPTALMGSFVEIGPRIIGGLVRALDPKEVKRAYETSNTLISRSPDVAIYEAMEGAGKFLKAQRKTADIALKPLTILDHYSATATWLAAEAKAKANGIAEPTKYADRIVDKTQASAAKTNRSPIQSHVLGQTLTGLQTFVINHWGWLTRDVFGINNPNITKAQVTAKLFKYAIATAAINTIYEDGMGLNSPLGTPIKSFNEIKDEGGNNYQAVAAAAKELIEYVPIYGGTIKYNTQMGGPLVSTLWNVKNVAERIINKKEDINDEDIAKLSSEMGKLAGIPGANQFFKSYRAYARKGNAMDIILGRYVEKGSNSGGRSGRSSRSARASR